MRKWYVLQMQQTEKQSTKEMLKVRAHLSETRGTVRITLSNQHLVLWAEHKQRTAQLILPTLQLLYLQYAPCQNICNHFTAKFTWTFYCIFYFHHCKRPTPSTEQ